MPRKLSPRTIERLCDDYRRGMGTVTLARKWGIGQSTALTYVREAGITRRTAGSCGHKYADVDDDYKPSRAEAQHLERETAKVWAKQNMQAIVAAYKAGDSVATIAAALGLEPGTVRRAILAASRDGMVTRHRRVAA